MEVSELFFESGWSYPNSIRPVVNTFYLDLTASFKLDKDCEEIVCRLKCYISLFLIMAAVNPIATKKSRCHISCSTRVGYSIA